MLVVIFSILPFIKVDIYTSSRGLLKPKKERINLTLITSGKVLTSKIEINKYVNKGDTLLILDNQNNESQLTLIRFNIEKTKRYIRCNGYFSSCYSCFDGSWNGEYFINQSTIN